MSLGPKLLIASGLIALLMGAHACSRTREAATPVPPTPLPSPTPSPSPTPTPINPQALLEESGRAMEKLRSFRFRLVHESGGTPLLPNLVVQEVQGDVIKPDRISADFSGTFGGFAIKSSLISLGDASYMTNPLTGQWESVPTQVSPLAFFDPGRGIAAMMSRVEEASLLPGDSRRTTA